MNTKNAAVVNSQGGPTVDPLEDPILKIDHFFQIERLWHHFYREAVFSAEKIAHILALQTFSGVKTMGRSDVW